jgi:hypothetical protein
MDSSPDSTDSLSPKEAPHPYPSPPTSISGRQKSADERELEQLSHTLSVLLIQQQWDHPMLEQYYSAQMKAYWDEIPTASNRDDYLGGMQKAILASPRYSMEVLNTCAAIEPDGRSATSWVTTVVRDLPFPNQGGMARETVVRSTWRKTTSGWKIIKNVHTPGAGPAFA